MGELLKKQLCLQRFPGKDRGPLSPVLCHPWNSLLQRFAGASQEQQATKKRSAHSNNVDTIVKNSWQRYGFNVFFLHFPKKHAWWQAAANDRQVWSVNMTKTFNYIRVHGKVRQQIMQKNNAIKERKTPQRRVLEVELSEQLRKRTDSEQCWIWWLKALEQHVQCNF